MKVLVIAVTTSYFYVYIHIGIPEEVSFVQNIHITETTFGAASNLLDPKFNNDFSF